MKKQDVVNLFDITGKVALVTGATGGFGAVAAKALAAAGAKVMLSGRNTDKLEECKKEIIANGGIAACSAGDAINYDDVKKVVKDTVDTFGGIDIFLSASGVSKPAPIVDQPVEDWQASMDTNVKGAYLFCKEVGKVMIKQGRGGKVILLGSARGKLGMANYSGYSTSKGAVHLLGKTLACEWGQYKINVNVLSPTVFRTALTQWMFDDNAFYLNFLRRIPIGRLGEPEDFIGITILLSSKASDFITGAVIDVDGGYAAG
jgi:NAD(P)-dependent dehydrogenase (short-subunit alcohol dehydrogenase family)